MKKLLLFVNILCLTAGFIAAIVLARFPANPPLSLSDGDDISEDVDIHYRCYGNGERVLQLHGGLSRRLSRFSKGPWLVDSERKVIWLDARGDNDPPPGHSETSHPLFAKDATQGLDHFRNWVRLKSNRR